MNRLSNDCPLGIFSWFGWVMPLPERLALIKKAGFEAASLWWEDEIGSPGINRAHMPDLVRDAGLMLDNVHVPYDGIDDLWSEDAIRRERVVRKHLDWIDEFARYDIPLMVMHVLDRSYPPAPNQYGVECISRIVSAAEAAGVGVAIENTGEVSFIDYILSRIESKSLGFCYDSSHDWLYSSNKGCILEKCGHRLLCTHLSDNDGIQDRHWLPGLGGVDWKVVRTLLPLETFSGVIGLEITASEHQRQNMLPGKFLRHAYQTVADLLGQVSDGEE